MSQQGSQTQGPQWPDPDKSHELMDFVLNHYVKHHEAVLRKLNHARDATQQSIEELSKMADYIHAGDETDELRAIKSYDQMWTEIIERFRKSGMPEEDLLKVERILLTIPQIIKKYYDVLIEQDRVLKELTAELDFDRYREAMQTIKAVQAQPNPMTGLGPDAYDIDDDEPPANHTDEEGKGNAFIFRPTGKSKKKDGKKK